jgi:predicted nucleic acid-binding protein
MAPGVARSDDPARRRTLTPPVNRGDQPLTLLDACAVVNLYATRAMGPILATVDGPVAIVDVVAREAQYVFRGGDGEDSRERDPVAVQSFIDDSLLEVVSTDDEEELLTFIDLSQDIGEGEAMTAALAVHRGCIVVTDDRKATRVMLNRGVTLRTSLELIRVWSVHSRIPDDTLRAALADLRQRGRYEPPRSHALRDWWDEIMGA